MGGQLVSLRKKRMKVAHCLCNELHDLGQDARDIDVQKRIDQRQNSRIGQSDNIDQLVRLGAR